MNKLEQALQAAHAAGDAARLVEIYTSAADQAQSVDQEAFLLTHAHVFALECNHPTTAALRQRLMDQGREGPLAPPLPPLR